ncbi:hypothetical protein Franean1_0812 [Parafrankia sp. EAN1pec]|nr:hypothetical protein Franean1_0812 [Frankia sp. EAN1pec]
MTTVPHPARNVIPSAGRRRSADRRVAQPGGLAHRSATEGAKGTGVDAMRVPVGIRPYGGALQAKGAKTDHEPVDRRAS